MHAKMDKTVHVRPQGTMTKPLTRLDPKLHRKHTVIENGKLALSVELIRALWGTLRAASLFWKLLMQKLLELDFVINPCDWCVANKMVNGKQLTTMWHVDDLKVSHVEPNVVTEFTEAIDKEFGDLTPITVKRGKVHDRLGMTLDCRVDGKVKTIMKDCINNMLEESPADVHGEAATPVAEHLFSARSDPPASWLKN